MIRPPTALALALCFACSSALSESSDADALELQPETQPDPSATRVASPLKAFVEVGAGVAQRRPSGETDTLSRLSADLRWSPQVAKGLRAVASARLDKTDPQDPFVAGTVFSLRELYFGWQPGGEGVSLEAGRINLRNGPGYGYNPTDFFRDFALRTITTANPFTLREQRLGAFMASAQRVWQGGAVAFAFAPELDDKGPNGSGSSVDAGATNARNRTLVSLSTSWSQTVSSQLLVYREDDSGVRIGANGTALLSDALVAHAEFTRSRESELLARALGTTGIHPRVRNRGVIGLTYTTASRLSLTAEYLYNGFALDRTAWRSAVELGPAALATYFVTAQRLQDSASRDAWFLYANQRDFIAKNVELTVLAKVNGADRSRVIWADLRYKMERVDLALQAQSNAGGGNTEAGIIPLRTSVGVVASLHF